MSTPMQLTIDGHETPHHADTRTTTGAVQILVYGDAQPAGSKTIARARNGRTFVRDANRNAAGWKSSIAAAAGAVMGHRPLLDGALHMTLTVYRARPKGHYGKRGLLPSAPAHPTTKPDTLKLARAAEDALTGVVYRDDAQIVRQHHEKRYGEPARIEITVHTLDLEIDAP